MSRPMTASRLREESSPYLGTCGDSATACQHRFVPAFRNEADGRVEIARLPDGRPAPMHLITSLPACWASRRDTQGRVLALIDGVIAGFVRDGCFFTREQAAQQH